MKRVLMGSAFAIVALAGTAHAEGFVSGAYANSDSSSDLWAIDGRALLGQNFAVDGAYANIDGDSAWNVGGHVFTRNDKWLLGAFVGFTNQDVGSANFDTWTFAGEGQYYCDRMTLTGNVSYSDADSTVKTWNVNGRLHYFVQDNLDLNGGLGWSWVQVPGPGDDDGVDVGVGAEYQFDGSPISAFAGYDHTEAGGSDNVWNVGLRWNIGEGTLLQHSRSGVRLPNGTTAD
jgi:hypothetical protein